MLYSNLLNNNNTNNVETHTCILPSVFLGLLIVRCWEAMQHMLCLREYSNQRDKNIKKFNGLSFYLCFNVMLILLRSNVVFSWYKFGISRCSVLD